MVQYLQNEFGVTVSDEPSPFLQKKLGATSAGPVPCTFSGALKRPRIEDDSSRTTTTTVTTPTQPILSPDLLNAIKEIMAELILLSQALEQFRVEVRQGKVRSLVDEDSS